MERLVRVLVVEDSPHHTESARKLLAGKAELDFVGNYEDFLQKFWEKPFRYDGVLSDIFFPTDDKYFKGHAVPAGVGVFFLCLSVRIPCVLVTAGHHHGKDYEWVARTIGNIAPYDSIHSTVPWPLIDVGRDGTIGTGELDVEAPEKGWVKGFKALSDAIRKKK